VWVCVDTVGLCVVRVVLRPNLHRKSHEHTQEIDWVPVCAAGNRPGVQAWVSLGWGQQWRVAVQAGAALLFTGQPQRWRAFSPAGRLVYRSDGVSFRSQSLMVSLQ
jgi:hypothetical protein